MVAGQGTGLFARKAAMAAAAGAVAAVIFNNAPGELNAATTYAAAIPVVGISRDNGNFLKCDSVMGSDPTGVSAQKIRVNASKVFKPLIADFSSRGPVQGAGP